VTSVPQQKVGSLEPNRAYVILTTLIGIWLFWDAFVFQLVTYSPYADYWEHTGLFTEWLRNFSNPMNPHVLDPDLSPRYMPWFYVLTWLGTVFGFDAITLMGISAVVSYALIVLGMDLFFRKYFNDAWAPTVGFLVMFFAWGVSWNWSNLYQLRSFFYIAGYPSSFVFGLSLISFWLTLRVIREEMALGAGCLALLLLAALMFLCHPLTGVLGIFGCGLLVVTESRVALQRRALILLALFLGSVLAELWPYFSVLEVVLGRSGGVEARWADGSDPFAPLARLRSGIWMHVFYNPKYLLSMLGLGWLCIGAWFYMLYKRRDAFILLGGIAMMVPYFAHLFISVPLAHRFLLFAIFFFHMAGIQIVLDIMQAWFAAREQKAVSGRQQNVVVALAAVFVFAVIMNVALLAADFTGKHLTPRFTVLDKFAKIPDGNSVVELYERLTMQVGPEDVVMAVPDVAWPLPTVRGKAVSAYHENPLLLDQFDRAEVVDEFFTEGTTGERREEILVEYQVKFVLLKNADTEAPESFMNWLNDVSEPVASVGEYTMYRLVSGPAASAG
jgi:hypothetical protein